MIGSLALSIALFITAPVGSETVDVDGRGKVDLKSFVCTDTPRSSVIQRVCYDRTRSYALIQRRGAWYQYCQLSPAVFGTFTASASLGQFYAQNIQNAGEDGPYDCRRQG